MGYTHLLTTKICSDAASCIRLKPAHALQLSSLWTPTGPEVTYGKEEPAFDLPQVAGMPGPGAAGGVHVQHVQRRRRGGGRDLLSDAAVDDHPEPSRRLESERGVD